MEIINLKTENFEGPLDLLLALISRHKIDIFDIPISEIAEQYTAVLDDMRELNMEVTSDFLVMAAELMLIKSRLLLPRDPDEEDPRTPLVDALLEHQRAVAASEFLRRQSAGHYDTFTKPASLPERADYSVDHRAELLAEAFARIAERLADRLPSEEPELFKRIGEERYYTVEEKSESLFRRLEKHGSTDFERLFDNVKSRGEAVALFLAVLECLRDGYIDAEHNGKEIVISFIRRPDTATEDTEDEYE